MSDPSSPGTVTPSPAIGSSLGSSRAGKPRRNFPLADKVSKGGQQQERAKATRRQVGELLGLHPDSVTRSLHEGLACAVLAWGGRGKEMVFDRAQVERWRRSMACATSGRPWCPPCYDVRYDCHAVAEHLLQTRHGLSGCRECNCPWPLVQPCEASAR